MKKKLLSLGLCLLTSSLFAMEYTKERVNELVSQNEEGSVTTVTGVVARDERGGKITVTLIYNDDRKCYSGTIHNNNFSLASWKSAPLDDDEAKQYYDELTCE